MRSAAAGERAAALGPGVPHHPHNLTRRSIFFDDIADPADWDVRYPPGNAAAIFWPDCLTLPITQNQQLRCRWDGMRMTHYLAHGATEWTIWPIDGVR